MSLLNLSAAILVASLILIALAACATPRRFGDAEGSPVAFSVRVERPFFQTMKNHQWQPGVGAGVGFGSGGGSGVGLGLGLGFTSTSVYLIGGDAAGQADVFRKELSWGENSFTVPLRPGRSLVLGVQAQGGREGWESLGTVLIPSASGAHVRVVMDADGAHLTPAPVSATAPATATAR